MTTATLTPFAQKEGARVGRRTYRKQILPIGTINYQGRKIEFDRGFLAELAESFQAGAYDQVPFVLADDENRHNMDPERFRGEVKGLELSNDGLDAIVEFNDKGAALIESNPRLGVSARIVEGLAKADGRQFTRAIQHVLGTMDPRVTGLHPWTAVDLAVYTAEEQVVDLTAATYEETKVPNPTPPTETQTPPAEVPETPEGVEDVTEEEAGQEDQPLDLSSLSDEDFEKLLAAAAEAEDAEDAEDDSNGGEEGGEVQTGQPQTDLSTPQIDLAANVDDSDLRSQVQQMRKDLAAEQWKSRRQALVRDGVPPHLLDLAAPLLSSPDAAVIDLSTSDTPVNATQILTDVIEACKGLVDLSEERGHGVDLSNATDQDAALLDAWQNEYHVL